MTEYVNLSQKVNATYFDNEHEEWSIKTTTIWDILDSVVCDDYMVLRIDHKSKSRWIPLNEQLPEQDDRVLVYTVAHEYHVWDAMPNRAENYFWEDENGLYHSKYEVEKWLPIPEI